MGIKVNDYVRTKAFGIKKVKYFEGEEPILENGFTALQSDGYKSSSRIIDLIEKKDIVVDYDDNIYQVIKVFKDYVFTNKKNKYGQVITLVDYQIKSIVTKEMFEQMEYKID